MALPYLALLATSGVSGFLFTTPIWYGGSWAGSVFIASTIGLWGVLASIVILWSAQRDGRFSSIGLAMAGLYAVPLVISPYGLAPFHLFAGPVALVLVAALVNWGGTDIDKSPDGKGNVGVVPPRHGG